MKITPKDLVTLKTPQVLVSGRHAKPGTRFRVGQVYFTSRGERANLHDDLGRLAISGIPLDRLNKVEATIQEK